MSVHLYTCTPYKEMYTITPVSIVPKIFLQMEKNIQKYNQKNKKNRKIAKKKIPRWSKSCRLSYLYMFPCTIYCNILQIIPNKKTQKIPKKD